MSHSHEAPGLPQVTDEAGDSPAWLSTAGYAFLFLVAAIVITLQMRAASEPAPAQDAEAGDVEEAK